MFYDTVTNILNMLEAPDYGKAAYLINDILDDNYTYIDEDWRRAEFDREENEQYENMLKRCEELGVGPLDDGAYEMWASM